MIFLCKKGSPYISGWTMWTFWGVYKPTWATATLNLWHGIGLRNRDRFSFRDPDFRGLWDNPDIELSRKCHPFIYSKEPGWTGQCSRCFEGAGGYMWAEKNWLIHRGPYNGLLLSLPKKNLGIVMIWKHPTNKGSCSFLIWYPNTWWFSRTYWVLLHHLTWAKQICVVAED